MPLKRTLLVVLVSFSLTVALVPGTHTVNKINEGLKNRSTFVRGSLYPQATESRDLRRLDGVWNFRLSPVGDPEYGFQHGWNLQDLHLTGPVKAMPVPSSYNDVTTDPALRDHVGMAWYDRRFRVPRWWLADGQRVWLHFGSVHYAAKVWVNGQLVMSHEIGHLPFEAEVTATLLTGRSNLLTVAVNNVLLNTTIPQGWIEGDEKHPRQQYTFDFFNYAGIHRSVYLYSTPKIYIDAVAVITDIQGQIGVVKYNVTYKGTVDEKVKCQVDVMNHNYTIVGSLTECAGEVHVTNASLWWPYLMNSNPGYLYTLMASVFTENPKILDVYTVKFGFRKITWTNTTMYINNQPLYIRGFGMHEDSDFRGKGWDPVLWTKNFNLLQWVGANAFRTSHYPYAEEIYQMADERGIMIIDECPSGDTDHLSDELLENHKQSLTELIHRDKNHPSVVMWSIANEARTQYEEADAYFGAIVKHVKSMDMSRPVSMATAQQHDGDKAKMPLKRTLLVVLVSFSLTVALVPGTHTVNKINEGLKNRSTFVRGSLYPQATESRDLRRLDGVWNFRLSPVGDPEYGFQHGWNLQDLHLTGPVKAMPVPSSYNDVTTDPALRDHVGMAWYDRRFRVPRWWLADGQRVWLHFGSVHYAAKVWVNGQLVMSHEIGHLPFEAEVTATLLTGRSNLLTVAVNNVLLNTTIPQGWIEGDEKHPRQQYTFDFFNYAGIHRSVYLYSTPKIYIDAVAVITDIQGQIGVVKYNVTYKGTVDEKVKCQVDVMNHNYTIVGSLTECAGEVHVTNASLWWPYLMNSNPGYLYTLMASVFTENPKILDVYTVKFGFRKITWTNTTMYINNQPLYIRGFGMHEDSDFRGKGWDPVLWTKNFNLLQWVGANAFRTSHYPYAEEIYQMADERGIMIIDECPSGDTDHLSDELLENHKQSLTELIHRDKNHPSVVMWSIANEARTQYEEADAYFGAIVKHVKSMDMSRPVSMATAQQHDGDKAAKHLDVIMFNRYIGWYGGELQDIKHNVVGEATNWHRTFNKPVFMSEYGAEGLPGIHSLPVSMWSEDYQVAVFSEYFKAFDQLRAAGFFAGELIWNFADFQTQQGYTRVDGNKKGIFTRARQPKAAAHLTRARYLALAAADSGVPPPPARYVIDNTAYHQDRLP